MTPHHETQESEHLGPERGASAADERAEGRAWLDNPENLRRFFDGVARAMERARTRGSNSTRG
jgi:hypothetical protein